MHVLGSSGYRKIKFMLFTYKNRETVTGGGWILRHLNIRTTAIYSDRWDNLMARTNLSEELPVVVSAVGSSSALKYVAGTLILHITDGHYVPDTTLDHYWRIAWSMRPLFWRNLGWRDTSL
jgi:hypothetical protein